MRSLQSLSKYFLTKYAQELDAEPLADIGGIKITHIKWDAEPDWETEYYITLKINYTYDGDPVSAGYKWLVSGAHRFQNVAEFRKFIYEYEEKDYIETEKKKDLVRELTDEQLIKGVKVANQMAKAMQKSWEIEQGY